MFTTNLPSWGLVEPIQCKELLGGSDNIVDVKWLSGWVPWVDAEEYLFRDNLPVVLVETSEELCIEVLGSEFVIVGQRDSDGEETSIILHDIIFTPNV